MLTVRGGETPRRLRVSVRKSAASPQLQPGLVPTQQGQFSTRPALIVSRRMPVPRTTSSVGVTLTVGQDFWRTRMWFIYASTTDLGPNRNWKRLD